MSVGVAVLLAFAFVQITAACENCIELSKEEKAMFRSHSEACQVESHVEQSLVDALLKGEVHEQPTLKAHVYCVLLRCKLITKSGKLIKSNKTVKIGHRASAKASAKIMDVCSKHPGDTPEDLAWHLFICGFDKKTTFHDDMPVDGANADLDNNSH